MCRKIPIVLSLFLLTKEVLNAMSQIYDMIKCQKTRVAINQLMYRKANVPFQICFLTKRDCHSLTVS